MTFPKSERRGFLSYFPHDGQRNAVSLISLRHSGQLTNAINQSPLINKKSYLFVTNHRDFIGFGRIDK